MKRYIIFVTEDKNILGGKPCIEGTRLRIELLKNGLTKFKKNYPIKKTGDWWSESIAELISK